MSNNNPSTSTNNVDQIVQKNLERPQYEFRSDLNKERIPVQLFINCLRILMFKDAKNPTSVIQKLDKDLDKVISLEDIDKIIDKEFSNVESMYVQSTGQLKTDVRAMIDTVGIPMLTPGVGAINFESVLRQNYDGSKQGCLASISYAISECVTTKINEAKEIREFLLNQFASEMKYWEFLKSPAEAILRKTCDIVEELDNETTKTERKKTMLKFFQDLAESNVDDFVGAICSLIFGESEYHQREMIESKWRKQIDGKNVEQDSIYATELVKYYLTIKDIISQLKETDFLMSYYDVSENNLEIPKLSFYFFGNSKTKKTEGIPQENCFVFRKDVEMQIMIRQKLNGTYTDKKAVISDNKIIECISFADAIREIAEACGDVEIESCINEQPMIGFYSAPPIVSPFNTLCKPAFIIFRDFYNFLVYELKIMKTIKDENIKDLTAYVLRFCNDFQVTRNGLFCIDWLEFCKFLDEGRSIFKGKLEQDVEKIYTPTKEDVKSHGSEYVIARMKENVKAGLLVEYEKLVEFAEKCGRISQIEDGFKLVDQAMITPFLETFPDLCIMVHRQNACDKLPLACALRVHPEYTEDQYCYSTLRPKPQAPSVPQPAIRYLNALRQLLFPKVFDQLPRQLVRKLGPSSAPLNFEEFQKMILPMQSFFEPFHRKMYCYNIDEMWTSLKSILLSYTIDLRTGVLPLLHDRHDQPTADGSFIVLKSALPASLSPLLKNFFKIKTPITAQLLQFQLAQINNECCEFVTIDKQFMADIQHVLGNHKMIYDFSTPIKANLQSFRFYKHGDSIENILKLTLEYIFYCHYAGEEMLTEMIRNEVKSSASPIETISEILGASVFLQEQVVAIFDKIPKKYTGSYWRIPMKSIPPAILKVNVIKDGDKQHKFVFKKDFQLAIRMTTKKTDIYDYDEDEKEYECRINAFKYIDYDEAMEVIRKVCKTTVLTKEMTVGMYGYQTCMAIISPINTTCKPYHIYIREFFNFLNYEIDIFRLIFNTHFNNLRDHFRDHILKCLPKITAPCCVEVHSRTGLVLKNQLNMDARQLSIISDKAVRPMYIPTVEDLKMDGLDSVVAKLRANVKPGLLRGYDYAIDCISDKLLSVTDNITLAKLADEAIYRSFIIEVPVLCMIMHNQKQCWNWSRCTMSFTDDKDATKCDIAKSDSIFKTMEQRFIDEKPKMQKMNVTVIKNAVKGQTMLGVTSDHFPQFLEMMNEVQNAAPRSTNGKAMKKPSPTAAPKVVGTKPQTVQKKKKVVLSFSAYERCSFRRSKKNRQRNPVVQNRQVPKVADEAPEAEKEETPSSSKQVEQVDPVQPIDPVEPVQPVESVQPIQPVQSAKPVTKKVKKSRLEAPKIDIPLYNAKIIEKCLQMLLDKKTCSRVLEWNHFKQPEKFEWIEWHQVVEKLEKVRTVIPTFDNLLESMPKLRKCPGSAQLFGIGDCLDFWNPNTAKLTQENRKTRELVQNWIKALPWMDHFYHADKIDKRLFEMLIWYHMDQVAAGIGKAEIVSLRCPQVDLEEIMVDLRIKVKESRIPNQDIKDYNDLTTDEEVVNFLKTRAFGDINSDIANSFMHVLSLQLKKIEAGKRNYFINKIVFNIQRVELIRKSFCESEGYGIIRGNDKKTEQVIRTVRNGSLVFMEDKDENTDIFQYTTKEEAQRSFLNAEFVNLDDISLSVITPVVSQNHTLVIEVSTILDKILHIFSSSGKFDVLKLNTFVKKLSKYFKPQVSTTFCMDYHTAMDFIKEANALISDKVINKKQKITKIHQYIAMEARNRSFPSFEVMLSSLIGDYDKMPSQQTLEDFVKIAVIRTILFEYPQLAKVYHNQKMCIADGKRQFCSLSLLDEDETGDIQPCTRSGGHVEKFKNLMVERNITRLAKEDDMSSDNENENIDPPQIVEIAKPMEELDVAIHDSQETPKEPVVVESPCCSDKTNTDEPTITLSPKLDGTSLEKLKMNINISISPQKDEVLSDDDKEDIVPSQIVETSKPISEADVAPLRSQEFSRTPEVVEAPCCGTDKINADQPDIVLSSKAIEANVEKSKMQNDEVLSDDDKENIEPIQIVVTPKPVKKPVVLSNGPNYHSKKGKKPIIADKPSCSTDKPVIPISSQPKKAKVTALESARIRKLETKNEELNRKLKISQNSQDQLKKEKNKLTNQYLECHTAKKKLEWKTATEIEKLKDEIQKKNNEIEKLKMLLDNSDKAIDNIDSQFDKEYYQNFKTKGESLLITGKCQLDDFLSTSSDMTDRVRAEREFRSFSMKADPLIRMAEENIAILENEPMTTVDMLHKFGDYEEVFSAATLKKMEKKE